MSVSSHHDLQSFLVQASNEMQAEYERIRARALEDPGTAGDEGEENWAELLRNWLPSAYHIVTKGRILSHHGSASPQVDVLVLKPAYPPCLRDKKLYLAGGVAAAFECKLTLKAGHIRKAAENGVEIRKHVRVRQGSPYRELHSPILFGLLAHSHDWKRPSSRPSSNVDKSLAAADRAVVTHPREMVDVLCVADLGTWTATRMAWIGPAMFPEARYVGEVYGPNGAAASGYVGRTSDFTGRQAVFTPIGSMLWSAVTRLAWEDVGLRSFAGDLQEGGLPGRGQGMLRLWPSQIYSDRIRDDVTSLRRLSAAAWSEWGAGFW
jgi:hypothetical protein